MLCLFFFVFVLKSAPRARVYSTYYTFIRKNRRSRSDLHLYNRL